MSPKSMHRLLIAAIFSIGLFEVLPARAEEILWAKAVNGSSTESANAAAVDNTGHVYLVGEFRGILNFGDIVLSSPDNSDIFVAKMDRSGRFLWVKQAGGAGNETGAGIAVDSSGNVFITGSFTGGATFGTIDLASAGLADVYAAKLSTDGEWIWAKKGGGLKADYGRAIAVTSDGIAVVTGMFNASASFSPHNILSSGTDGVFVARLNVDGSWAWARAAGGHQWDSGWGIALDAAGTAYVAGGFSGTITFGPDSLTSAGGMDAFVAAVDPAGTWTWARRAGGTENDRANAVAIDSSSNILAAGHFAGTASFGATNLVSAGDKDIFAAKITPAGAWTWAQRAGGTSWDEAFAVQPGAASGVFVCGRFGSVAGNADFGAAALASAGGYDTFIAKLNDGGVWQWAEGAGAEGTDEGRALAVDVLDNIYAGGIFTGTVAFGTTNLTAAAFQDIFVLRLGIKQTVLFQAGAGGVLAGPVNQSVGRGDDCLPVEAVPSAGNAFISWSGPGGFSSTYNPLIYSNVTADATVTAAFGTGVANHTVSFLVAGSGGGTLLGEVTQVVAAGGSTTAVTADPDEGYAFSRWTGPGGFTSTVSPLVISNVTSSMAVTAAFDLVTFTVTFSPGPGGQIAGTTLQNVVPNGNTQPVEAISNFGYRFKRWTSAVPPFSSENNPLTLANITADMDLAAEFEIKTYTVMFTAGTGGGIVGTTPQTINHGASATAVSALAGLSHFFLKWTGSYAGTSNPLTLNYIVRDTSVLANFSPNNSWAPKGPEGGRVVALAVDPQNPDVLYAGAEVGGVWKSVDGGANWTDISDGLPDTMVTDFFLDPNYPQTLYLAINSGIYKTADGGANWTLVLRYDPLAPANPVNARIVEVGAADSLVVAMGGEFLYKSADGGASWSRVGVPPGYFAKFVRIHPGNSDILFLGTGDSETSSLGLIFKSADGGLTWNQAFPGRVAAEFGRGQQFAFHPYDPETILVGNWYPYGLIKSEDGGTTSTVLHDRMGGWIVAYDPVNPDIIYQMSGGGMGSLIKSIDGGQNWIRSDTGLPREAPDSAYVSQLSEVIVDPKNPSQLYAGMDGMGLYKSVDGAASWTESNKGFQAMWVRAIAQVPSSSTVYIGTGGKGIFKSTNRGETWTPVNNGLGDLEIWSLAVDPSNSQVLYAGTAYPPGTPGYEQGCVFKSTNGGGDWVRISEGLDPDFGEIKSILIDPRNPSTVYIGGRLLLRTYPWTSLVYKSADGGATWTNVTTPVLYNLESTALAMDAVDSSIIYLSTYASDWGGYNPGLFVSLNGGTTWAPTAFFNQTVWNVVADKTVPNRIYATANMAVGRSNDRGLTWTYFINENGISDHLSGPFLVNPQNTQEWYVGTLHQGVFATGNAGVFWSPVGSGLSGTVTALAISPAAPAGAASSAAADANRPAPMDQTSTRLFAAASLPGGMFSYAIDGQAVTLTSPNGGESWAAGTAQLIQWMSEGDIQAVKIESSVNGGSTWSVIIASTPNTGGYSWIVPASVSSSCLIRVSDATNALINDVSDAAFTIYVSSSPVISLSPGSMLFGSSGATATPAQSLSISNAGGGTMNWTAAGSAGWITVNPSSGTGSEVVQVGVNPTGLAVGTYQGQVVVNAEGGLNSPQTVTVNLNVIGEGADQPPFGNFDTPIDQSTVASSIAVTGWVLDDIGMSSVKVYRGTDLSDRVYIGDAVFVRGARPDVAGAYPNYPENDRAGWGYMLLTNFLPNGGNGAFQLLAYAADLTGHEILLGAKTISCDNAHAVLPFGAIDTPTQGGTASGRSFFNFGWALTPMPNSIPTNGSTLLVWLDGAPLNHPAYNYYRGDIATLFPGYANSDGAVGLFTLDTTSYTNGVHTIVWSAGDSAGNVDGIGSRYFNILNIGGAKAPFDPRIRMGNRLGEPPSETTVIVEDRQRPVYVRVGYDPAGIARTVRPDEKGSCRIEVPELTRTAVYLNEKDAGEGIEEMRARGQFMLAAAKEIEAGADGNEASENTPFLYRAYLLVGDEWRPLPAGSSFDAKNGILYWSLGPGFLGEYTLAFLRDEGGVLIRKTVIITVRPASLVPRF